MKIDMLVLNTNLCLIFIIFKEPARRAAADRDVLSQLTALRQQLKNEEKRVQQQMDRSTAVVCSPIFDLGIKAGIL